MRYLAELYYFEQADFPGDKAVRVTATVVASQCRYFYARILAPRSKALATDTRSGLLPQSRRKKRPLWASWSDGCSSIP